MLPIFLVDAFADRPFTGNPAGVCLIDGHESDSWLQQVAMEMNQAETAFVSVRRSENPIPLRWFTPTVEVDLCGHATLAAAHILWEKGIVNIGTTIRFSTRSGLLTASRHDSMIELDFPMKPVQETNPPPGLLDALNVTPRWIGRNEFDYFLVLDHAEDVRKLSPNVQLLATIDCRGVIVTAISDMPTHDFVSRFFAPAVGVNEDPVTGSAHCALAHYWSVKLGKSTMIGYQASQRGGTVRVTCQGDRVILAGKARTIVRGELVGYAE